MGIGRVTASKTMEITPADPDSLDANKGLLQRSDLNGASRSTNPPGDSSTSCFIFHLSLRKLDEPIMFGQYIAECQ